MQARLEQVWNHFKFAFVFYCEMNYSGKVNRFGIAEAKVNRFEFGCSFIPHPDSQSLCITRIPSHFLGLKTIGRLFR